MPTKKNDDDEDMGREEIEKDLDEAAVSGAIIFGLPEPSEKKVPWSIVDGMHDRLRDYDDDAKLVVCEQLGVCAAICKSRCDESEWVGATFKLYDQEFSGSDDEEEEEEEKGKGKKAAKKKKDDEDEYE